ncbi:MAG: hypothetical protein ACRECP_03845 [Methylocella sp.]
MPTGTCTVRLQNNSGAPITLVNSNVTNGNWAQQPPNTVANGATSGNFSMNYNFPAGGQSQFSMDYSIPGQVVPFTASAIIDQNTGGTVICTPSGAGPGAHNVTFNVLTGAPNFTVLFTFN